MLTLYCPFLFVCGRPAPKLKRGKKLRTSCFLRAVAALGLTLALCLSAGLSREARAQSAMETFSFGEVTLVALYDHPAAHEVKLFSGADPALINALVPSGLAASSVNAFLVQTGGKNVLIDTGMGAGAGGETVHSLALLGLAPADIDIILITHMHFDHIGGLTTGGLATYPRAVLKIGDLEQAFWLAPNAYDPKGSPFVDFASAKAAVSPYAARLQSFTFGDEVAPGITAIRAVGHTPGHTAFMVESMGRKVLVWGDVLHAISLQLAHPEIYPAYDYDPLTAAATRKTVLEEVSAGNIAVAGMHIPYPGVGRIHKDGEGYSFTPGL